jgi:hypothetical protein
MDHQPQADHPGLGKPKQNDIGHNGPCGMKGMKSDAASLWIINRIRQQMIQIHQNRPGQDQPVFHPHPGKKRPLMDQTDDPCRDQKMQQDVYQGRLIVK